MVANVISFPVRQQLYTQDLVDRVDELINWIATQETGEFSASAAQLSAWECEQIAAEFIRERCYYAPNGDDELLVELLEQLEPPVGLVDRTNTPYSAALCQAISELINYIEFYEGGLFQGRNLEGWKAHQLAGEIIGRKCYFGAYQSDAEVIIPCLTQLRFGGGLR
jgi:hypothetical protein